MALISGNSKIISGKNISSGKKVGLSSVGSTANLWSKKTAIEKQIEMVTNQHNQILEQMEVEKNRILEDTKHKSLDIEKQAYDKGYNQGIEDGYNDGYQKAYNETLEKAKLESEGILNESTAILLNARNDVLEYMQQHKNKIIELSISIAEQVLKTKFEDENAMNLLLEEALKDYGAKKSLVIKVNHLYKDSIEEQIDEWKSSLSIQDDIHILGCDFIEKGNAVIEGEKGSVLVGLDVVLEKLKSELL